jgi:large subunit ribosomal protein L15e
MGYYKYLRQTWQTLPDELLRERLIAWRREPVFVRTERPTRLDRAHALGWKAKQGFAVVRVRIGKGTSKREKPAGGRKPLHSGMTKITPVPNLQHIAEMRVASAYPNMEVLNSYYTAEDGRDIWYEVILVDPDHPCIINDPKLKWICEPSNRGRVFRGLTSAGKSHRMLRGRGKGFERRNRPDKR